MKSSSARRLAQAACAALAMLAVPSLALDPPGKSAEVGAGTALKLAEKAVTAHRWSTQPRCVLYDDAVASGRRWIVAVREKHDRRCGGDPGVSPVVFRLAVDRRTGRVRKMSIEEIAIAGRWQVRTADGGTRP